MIASLPMYMRPETKDAHDSFWNLIHANLVSNQIDAPIALQSGEDLDFWQRNDLLLSQTCGMPYRLYLHDKVQLIGTPDFGLKGCPKGYYNSVLIVNTTDDRADITDFAHAKLAVNSKISQSGYSAPQNEAKKHGFQFENITISQDHVASARMVATGQADIAAIDAVTWRNIQRYDGFSNHISVLSRTPPTPGLPYICAHGLDKACIGGAIKTAIDALSEIDQDKLGITSLIPIRTSAYLAVENP